MTIDEMLDRMSSRELGAWRVYEEAFGPLGPTRGDLHAAQVVAAVVNMLRDPKSGRPLKLADAKLHWPGDATPQVDVDDQAIIVQQLAATLGGVISIGDPG